MGSCGKPKHLCKCKKKKDIRLARSSKRTLRYVGKATNRSFASEHGRKRDGLEKKPRPIQPVGIRFH